MLGDTRKPGVRNKCRGQVSDCVLFLLDGACPHTAIWTTETIEILQEVHFEMLEHTVYGLT